mgnify:CR=1 FL=1
MGYQAFDQYASEYDAWFIENSNVLETELRLVASTLRKDEKILSIGCGSGLFEKFLSDQYGINISHGIEPAEGMVEIARKRGLDVEVNTADYETLLRIPGVGVISAKRILSARRAGRLRIDDLPKLGVVMKRAQYFLTASGKIPDGLRFTPDSLLRSLIAAERPQLPQQEMVQLSLFDAVV